MCIDISITIQYIFLIQYNFYSIHQIFIFKKQLFFKNKFKSIRLRKIENRASI